MTAADAIEAWANSQSYLPHPCLHGLPRITAAQCLAYQTGSAYSRLREPEAIKMRRQICRKCPAFSTPGLTLRPGKPGQSTD